MSEEEKTRREKIKEFALEQAAQCWCTPETEMIEMDVRLGTAFANCLAGWIEMGAQAERGSQFYQGIVRQVGTPFGVLARTSDDGSVQSDVLALLVPGLVAEQRQLLEAVSNLIPRYPNAPHSELLARVDRILGRSPPA